MIGLPIDPSKAKGAKVHGRFIAKLFLGIALFVASINAAIAAPVTFTFRFVNGPATAAGTITLESTLVNPGPGVIALPNPAVLDLNVTVTGAAAGNGTFGLAAFGAIVFASVGALDFSRDLVGQPNLIDFNLFGLAVTAPTGVAPFTLGANGGASTNMTLAAMVPVRDAVPALDRWGMVILALLVAATAVVAMRRRR